MVSSPRRSTSHCIRTCRGQDRCNNLYRVSTPKHTQKPMVSSPRRSTSHCMRSCRGQDRSNDLYGVSIPKHSQKPTVSSPRRITSHCMRSCWGKTDAIVCTGFQFQSILRSRWSAAHAGARATACALAGAGQMQQIIQDSNSNSS